MILERVVGKANPHRKFGRLTCFLYTKLAYNTERISEFESEQKRWQRFMLPLHHTRIKLGYGIEPFFSCDGACILLHLDPIMEECMESYHSSK